MALTELWQSRKIQRKIKEHTQERVYTTEDLTDAPTIGSLWNLGDITLYYVVGIIVERYSVDPVAPDVTSIWKITVSYSSKYPYDTDDPYQYEWEYDMSAQSRKCHRAYGQNPAIVLTQSVDRYEPAFIYRVGRNEATVPRAVIISLAGRLNAGTFLGYDARYWLFLGAVTRKQGTSWWRTTYTFAYSDLKWVYIIPGVENDESDDTTYKIYRTGDFSLLNLTDPP